MGVKEYLDSKKYDGAVKVGKSIPKSKNTASKQNTPQPVTSTQTATVEVPDKSKTKDLTLADVDLIVKAFEKDENLGRFYWGNTDYYMINSKVRQAVQEDREDYLSGKITKDEFNNRDDLRYLKQWNPNYASALAKLEGAMHPMGVQANLYRYGEWDSDDSKGIVGYDRTFKAMGFDGTAQSIIGAKMSLDNITSFGYDPNRSHMKNKDSRNFVLHAVTRPTTQVYAGSYHRRRESEIIANRGQTLTFYDYKEEYDSKLKRNIKHFYAYFD